MHITARLATAHRPEAALDVKTKLPSADGAGFAQSRIIAASSQREGEAALITRHADGDGDIIKMPCSLAPIVGSEAAKFSVCDFYK